MLALSEKVVRIEATFQQHALPHAFGGALALAYYATPRATIDIDVNLFVPVSRADDVLGLLQALGAEPLGDEARARLARDEQVRLYWDRTPLDLFFAYDALHASCLERRQRMPFGDDSIHVLAAEDLLVFKAIFDREKDWRDLEELAFALGEKLDGAYAGAWLERILGASDPRTRRVQELIARYG